MSKFQTGDVVEYIGPNNWSKQHIINDVSYKGKGQFSYSTNKGAWFQDSDFKLIRKADSRSFTKLDEYLDNEKEQTKEKHIKIYFSDYYLQYWL